MKDWLKDHVLEAWGLSGLSISGMIALAKDALALGATNIEAFAFWSAACVALGFVIGLLASKNAKSIAEARSSAEIAKSHDQKELELQRMEYEREDKEAEEARVASELKKLSERVVSFMDEEPAVKIAVLEMYEHDFYDLKDGNSSLFVRLSKWGVREARDGYTRFTLRSWARKLIDDRPDLLDYAREMVEESRASAAAKRKREIQRHVLGCSVEEYISKLDEDSAILLARLVEGKGSIEKASRNDSLPGEKALSSILSERVTGDNDVVLLTLDTDVLKALDGHSAELREHAGAIACERWSSNQ